MTWLVDPFEPAFMQRALVAGVLVAVVCAVVGTWVVVRGLAFFADALAHGVLPGVAVAVITGIDVVVGAAVAALVMVFGIDVVRRRGRLADETAIGLLFVWMLAIGVMIVSRGGSVSANLSAYLFGNVLAVQAGDLWLLAVVTAVALAASALLRRPLLALCLDETKAAVLGMHPTLAHFALLALLAATIVSSFKAVGTLLVFGLLIGPPATASLVVRRVPAMMATAAAIGVASVVLGLLVSYHYDTAQGATMAAIAISGFFVTLAGRGVVAAADSRRLRVQP